MSKRIILVIACLFFLLTACGPKNDSGEQAQQSEAEQNETISQEETEVSPAPEEESAQVFINYNPGMPSSDEVLEKISTSYYYLRLNQAEKKVYDEILAGINLWQDTIDITPINRSSFSNIMNIILIDQPDIFQLAPEYYFTTVGENNYVNSVSLVYSTSKEEFDSLSESYQNTVRGFESPRSDKITQIQALNNVLEDVSRSYATTEQQREEIIPAINFIAKTYQGNSVKITNFDLVRIINTYLHHAGVNSLVAFGDEKRILDGTLISYDGNHVTLDIDKFKWFNEVQLNSNWYIVDLASQLVFNETSSLKISASEVSNNPAAIFLATTDRIYSGSHSFWPTNENLGILPNCSSYEFSPVYNSGSFVPSPDEKEPDSEYMAKYIELFQKNHIESILKQNSQNPNDVLLFFENEELFNLYRQTFDAATKKFDVNNKQIEDYVLSPYKQYLILKIEKIYCY